MNRSWIAKFICPALVGTLVLTTWATTQAAPLINISIEGRRAGEAATAWRSAIGGPSDASGPVKAGDRIEFRLRLNFAPIGTSNTQGAVTTTINSLTSTDGMNSMYVNLGQAATDSIQVNFLRGPLRTPASNPPEVDPESGDPRTYDYQNDLLPTAWKGLPGFHGGNLTARAGTPYNNLTDIRPIQGGGIFVGATGITTFAGPAAAAAASPYNQDISDFMVMTDGLLAQIMPRWGSGPGTSGAGRVNSNGSSTAPANIAVFDDTQANSSDPIAGFTPLTLIGVPEPSTFVLAGLGLVGLVAFARRRKV